MFSIFLHCAPAEEDLIAAELWEQDTSGVADEPGGLRAFFNDEDRAPELLRKFERLSPVLRRESPVDWEQVSRDAWPPVLVGSRFFLAPPWRDDPTPEGRLRLEIHPGMACGTGHHPATQLCLEAMERYVPAGAAVLDVGTGSGILSAAALLLNASRVVACDIDSEAVEIARARVNVPFFIGSIDAVQSNTFDVIVANISSEIVEKLCYEFQRVRRPGSTLILSGFQEWDLPEGFHDFEQLRRDEWVCLVVRD